MIMYAYSRKASKYVKEWSISVAFSGFNSFRDAFSAVSSNHWGVDARTYCRPVRHFNLLIKGCRHTCYDDTLQWRHWFGWLCRLRWKKVILAFIDMHSYPMYALNLMIIAARRPFRSIHRDSVPFTGWQSGTNTWTSSLNWGVCSSPVKLKVYSNV